MSGKTLTSTRQKPYTRTTEPSVAAANACTKNSSNVVANLRDLQKKFDLQERAS
jgi:hypothetical protein